MKNIKIVKKRIAEFEKGENIDIKQNNHIFKNTVIKRSENFILFYNI